jgi:4-amino-4-deoxy-L-arabinose transferase-like glycosyltransferase
MKKSVKSKGKSTRSWLLLVALLVLFLAVRLPALGRFVTTDEALWLRRSANFYYAVSNGDWASTFQSEHPGLVTMWAGAAGFQIEFPQYGQVGIPDVHDDQLVDLMENRGVSPMQVLSTARLVLVLIHAAAFGAAWPFARRLLGLHAAAIGMALIALDPFTIAHQRLLHLDGLLASFMLLSVLAFLDFQNTRNQSTLIISGIAAGLAILTKTPALFLLPLILVYSVWNILQRKEVLRSSIINLSLWGLVIAATFFAFFPALWLGPVEVAQQMVGYALGSAQGEYSGPLFFLGQIYPDGNFGAIGWVFYLISYIWRSTPLTLLGLVLAIWFLVAEIRIRKRERSNEVKNQVLQAVLALAVFDFLFTLFMTFAEKKFDRYLLPSHAPLMLIAGWGWVQLANSLAWFRKPSWRAPALLGAVAALQLISAGFTFPYYLSYYNPILAVITRPENVIQIGWGEGLDQAATYLESQPGIDQKQVASWYSTSFNLLYESKANDIPIALELSNANLLSLLANDYLVIYIHQLQRGTPQNLFAALQLSEPEHIVTINGLEYVRIYHQDPLTKPHPDGIYQVGAQIATGAWRSVGATSDSCYWVRRKYDGIVLEDYLGPPGGKIQISDGDFEVEFNGCGVWEYLGPN